MPRRLPQSDTGPRGAQSPKPKSVPPTALEAALGLLAVRARTTSELDRALTQRGHDPEVREAALLRLRELGYLDDERFAKDRAVGLLREGGHGERAVMAKLCAHGLPEALARRAWEFACEELHFDPDEAARALLHKRRLLGAGDRKVLARAARLLAARGFSDEVIARVLEVSALDPPGEGG